MQVDDSVVILGYGDPALVDSEMQFSCRNGFFPINKFTATCLSNGRWSPDPAIHNCTLGRVSAVYIGQLSKNGAASYACIK